MAEANQARREATLDALERVMASWPEQESFAAAVAETTSRTGYPAHDVERQLRHVAARCRGEAMRLVVDTELGSDADLSSAPSSVLVLASAAVPGLAIEGVASALALGATALVRPSKDETVLHHLLGDMRVWEPELGDLVETVGVGGVDPPWGRAEAAVVFGNDETIAFVRDRLDTAAAQRIAAYGSRQAIAVVAAGADVDPSWARRLADDVLTFRQRGCMCPSWLFLVGAEDETSPLVEAVGRELALAKDRHGTPVLDERFTQRRSTDADVLAAIAAGMAPGATALHAGDARMTLVRIPDEAALVAQVRSLGSILQTAVVATSREDRPRIAQALLDAGCTRVCLPGDAHLPDPLWPQDGIGRVAPLMGARA